MVLSYTTYPKEDEILKHILSLGDIDTEEMLAEAMVLYAEAVKATLNGNIVAIIDDGDKRYQEVTLPSLRRLREHLQS